jgi:hypothetical protein
MEKQQNIFVIYLAMTAQTKTELKFKVQIQNPQGGNNQAKTELTKIQ